MKKVHETVYDMLMDEIVKVAKDGQYTSTFNVIEMINQNFQLKKEEALSVMSTLLEKFKKSGFDVTAENETVSISWPNL